ncbi:hypothetical protein Shyhy01_40660 [Streptomyces hygroscopicus subsp. hygroscopicus]|uniref:hypothetical protein n=1 Tax=Streptomyces sp. KHY 26 TaxID=3097359 RepID=UPI0024A01A7E|nr:hypothetical protein [Streptomyces hygroscopicus]GLX51116.1 hypothetical protein Shyhy01_40660 [Streptomyces hygroscopicus subsp. hygroscopicus]
MAERREQTARDEVLTRIGQVVMLHHGGDREEARSRFLDLWAEIGEDGDPLHRCTLAHYLADTQDDPADELAWDLRALAAARELPEGHPRSVPGFFPSLHLNLAADYAKLGRTEAARTQLGHARAAADVLPDDGYGAGVRAAIGRLELRLGQDGPPGGGAWGPPRQRPS